MASKTMREIAAKHAAELKRLEQSESSDAPTESSPTGSDDDSYDNTNDDSSDEHEQDSDGQDSDSYDDSGTDDDNESDEDSDKGPGNEPDYRNKFDRLRKKQSKIEKEKAELAKKVQLLEENLELAKQHQASNATTQESPSNSNTPKNTASEKDIDAYLEENLGDDWSYMDESSKRSFRFLAKQTLEKLPDQSTIDEIVTSKLQEQNKRKKLSQFTRDLDSFVRDIDPDSDFHEVVNEAGFDEYLQNNRVAKAMFIEASQNIDDDSKQMMQDVLSGYLGKTSITPKLTTKVNTPDVQTKSKPRRSAKKPVITEAQIDKAIRDAKIPSKRKAAQKILLKAQELGLI